MYSGISGSSYKGFAGLASGIDTESLVEGLTLGTQTKIDKQYQEKQLIQWKKEAYRSVTKSLMDFNNKFFSVTSPNYILSSKFFNTYVNNTQSEFLKLSGNLEVAKNLTINKIESLATKSQFVSSPKGNEAIKGSKIDFSTQLTQSALAGEKIGFKYGDKEYSITLDKLELPGDATPEEKQAALAKQLQEKMNAAVGGDKDNIKINVSIDATNGLTIQSADTTTISITESTSTNAQEILSLTPLAEGSTATDKITSTIDLDKAFNTLNFAQQLEGKTMTFSLDGVSKTITFGADLDSGEEIATFLNTELQKAFGRKDMSASFDSSNGILSFQINGNENSNLVLQGGTAHELLGTTAGSSTKLSPSKTLGELMNNTSGSPQEYDLTINGQTLTFNDSDTIENVMSKVNSSAAGVKLSYSTTTGSFTLESKAEGELNQISFSGDLAQSIFGMESFDGNLPTIPDGINYHKGTDASFAGKLNGQDITITRPTNTINIDGLIIDLVKPTNGELTEPIKFDISTNPDQVVDSIKSFVEEYNAILTTINGLTSQKADRDYPPLTDAQKKDMSEDEIKKWEEKAKEGLLYNDPTLQKISNNLRSAIFTPVNGVNITLKDIGISSGNWEDKGRITLDEEKLRQALTERPDDVKALFTNNSTDPAAPNTQSSGIMVAVKDVLTGAVSTTGTKGSLLQIAGIPKDRTDGDNQMNKQLEQKDKRIKELQRRLVMEQNRYWKQFTAMEKYIDQMNSQSAWLSQQFM